MEGIIKKLIYYRDVKFFFEICLKHLKIFIVLRKDNRSIVDLIPPVNINSKKITDTNKIIRYVNLCILLFRKLGFKDTCLTRSVLLCSVLRFAGVDARVHFGAAQINGKFIGHCWLDCNKEEGKDYTLLCSYP